MKEWTIEANRSKCMAVCVVTQDAMCLRMLLHDFDMGAYEPIMVHNEDLWLSFESVKSHVDHRNYKHIDVRYHFVNGYIVESR